MIPDASFGFFEKYMTSDVTTLCAFKLQSYIPFKSFFNYNPILLALVLAIYIYIKPVSRSE